MDACPKCGFTFAWQGAKCGHCHYPEITLSPESEHDDFLESRILYKAGRHNHLPHGRTWRFRDIAIEMQQEIRRIAGDCIRGKPILTFVDSPQRWTLLTTREIICWNEGQLCETSLNEMRSVRCQSRPPEGATSEEIDQWKNSWEFLRIVDHHDAEAIIWIPCGSEAFTLWNILLPFVRGNR